ncbi:MAG: T9SS type A sorting domain-containing protein, partial [Sphingobacteriales bacterium]
DILYVETLQHAGDNPSYEVSDVAGRTVLSGKMKDKNINVAMLRPGTYVLVLQGTKGKSSRMFVKS